MLCSIIQWQWDSFAGAFFLWVVCVHMVCDDIVTSTLKQKCRQRIHTHTNTKKMYYQTHHAIVICAKCCDQECIYALWPWNIVEFSANAFREFSTGWLSRLVTIQEHLNGSSRFIVGICHWYINISPIRYTKTSITNNCSIADSFHMIAFIGSMGRTAFFPLSLSCGTIEETTRCSKMVWVKSERVP